GVREGAQGTGSSATDREVRRATFAVRGRLYVAELERGTWRLESGASSGTDPRLDPAGGRLAYVRDGGLRAIIQPGATERTLAAEEDPNVTWGLAEFVAAEEIGRLRGFWWMPDGT